LLFASLLILAGVLLAVLLVAVVLFGYAVVLPLLPRSAATMATARERELAGRLIRHLESTARTPRNLAHFDALEAAARYIETALEELGCRSVRHEFLVGGRSVRNIEVVVEPPDLPARAPSIVVGAHYDSPDDSPGANDNGTGLAALIELAGALAVAPPMSTRLRLVFFVNEELPYGKTEDMGSLRFARDLRRRGERVHGMIALETIGYFSDLRGSQRLPMPYSFIYPDVGNFIAFVALPGGRRFLGRCLRAFRRHSAFPSVGAIAPPFVEGSDLSDHWAFTQLGIPALMVTDTAPFRNPFYHTTDDLPETVDCLSLARVTVGFESMLRELAG